MSDTKSENFTKPTLSSSFTRLALTVKVSLDKNTSFKKSHKMTSILPSSDCLLSSGGLLSIALYCIGGGMKPGGRGGIPIGGGIPER